MWDATHVRKCVCVSLAALVLCASLEADTPQSVRLKRASVIQDRKAKPQGILLEFEISSEFVLADARLFHRPRGSLKYSHVGLKRDLQLFYVATIPFADEVEYYVELRPERGPAWMDGSPSEPHVLGSSDLPRDEKMHRSGKKVGIAVGIVIAIILGIAVWHKKSH